MPSNTISPTFEIKAPNFDSTQVAESHLMIEVSQGRFRFCVFHVPSNAVVWLEDYLIFSLRAEESVLKTIKSIYEGHQFLSANYWKSIRLSINVPNFTLIPEEIYSSEEAKNYLQLAAGEVLENNQVFDFHYPRFESVTVFSVENELINWFRETYSVKKISPVHLLDAFIEGICQTDDTLENINGLHIHFEEHTILLVYLGENKLHFCNKFSYQTSSDLLYYILFVMNELAISHESLVTLYGEITIFSENYTQLEGYLKNIKIAKFPKNLSFSSTFESIPEHRYFSLFSSYFIY